MSFRGAARDSAYQRAARETVSQLPYGFTSEVLLFFFGITCSVKLYETVALLSTPCSLPPGIECSLPFAHVLKPDTLGLFNQRIRRNPQNVLSRKRIDPVLPPFQIGMRFMIPEKHVLPNRLRPEARCYSNAMLRSSIFRFCVIETSRS